jgi:hypothetical protein
VHKLRSASFYGTGLTADHAKPNEDGSDGQSTSDRPSIALVKSRSTSPVPSFLIELQGSSIRSMRSIIAVLLVVLSQENFVTESFVTNSCSRWLSPTRQCSVSVLSPLLFLSTNSESSEEETTDYTQEEILLCIDLAVQPGVPVDEAVAKVSKFCQSFPFAAVLPVQPLHYMPVYEDGGVEVKFLRKKTVTKSSVDGGIRFFLQTMPGDDTEESDDPTTIEVTAKRNSKGQVIAKLMAEKLVVTNFVAGITGEEVARFGNPPTDFVQVKSLYHKWM